MVQKWDYKTVLRERGGIGPRFEIDGVPATPPMSFVALFKELGQHGWELVAHSATTLPSPFLSMTDEERAAFPLLAEDGQIYPMRQPGIVYWWIFKRPVSLARPMNTIAPAEPATALPSSTAVEVVTDAKELKRRYQAGERDFTGAQLSGAKLSGANLTKADLSGSDLSGADLSWCNLTKANLSGADLSGADLAGTILAKADLREADLTGVMLIDARLAGADLTDASLEGACVDEPELAGVASLRGATMPDGRRHD